MKGFTPIPKCWTLERTYGWFMLNRRIARDYEALLTRSEAIMHLAMTNRRLTGQSAKPS